MQTHLLLSPIELKSAAIPLDHSDVHCASPGETAAPAIVVSEITKVYRLYDSPTDRLKEALHPLSKKYHRDFYALNDISFQVETGETVGIIGRNGSGKSTLLKIIAGVLTPTKGNLAVKGKVSALLELGAGFNVELSGMENIHFSGTIMGYSKNEMNAKLDDILGFADIGEFIHQPVKTYSSGMFVRLAFAVAINVDPEVLIVDEALAVGDARFQLKCFKMLDRFREMGKTILFVSHDLGSVKRMCSRAILLENGELIAQAEPNRIVNIYSKLITSDRSGKSVKADIAALNIQEKGYASRENHESLKNDQSSNSLVRDEQATALLLDERRNQQVSGNEFSYGGVDGIIKSVAVTDDTNTPRTVFTTGERFKIHMVAEAYTDIIDPIYAMTIKDVRGQEIYGTNTLFINQATRDVSKGQELRITFDQPMNIMPGDYFISLGWTRFVGSDLVVVHRRYDVIRLEVLPNDRCFGIANCFSKIIVDEHASSQVPADSAAE
jgi:ABC-type polysaccharide/polyol phosphate transport system ATPase subunit